MQQLSNLRGVIVFALLVAVFSIGWIFGEQKYKKQALVRSVQVREDSPEYKFINPLLFVDNSNILFSDFAALEEKVESYISEKKRNGDADEISMYFRDLNSGRWAGVNEKVEYIPSSMLKVANLIAYLKISRFDDALLESRAHYKPKNVEGQHYKPTKTLTEGDYKVSTLLQEMIIRSDNAATDTLNSLRFKEILEVYNDLHLPDPREKKGDDDDFMSPEEYSSMFRVLFNSTYLPESYSENALRLLSLTEFDKGLVAGVPKGTTIAHKFGEHTRLLDGTLDERQLHDCGIVYYPSHPYFLCVMTKGMEFEKLERIIADISRMIFEEMESRYSKE